jgi:hypothetical protein
VGGNQGTFTQTLTWSDLGVPATLTYPQKAGVGPARTVTFDYTNGWLSRVHEGATNYASSISLDCVRLAAEGRWFPAFA